VNCDYLYIVRDVMFVLFDNTNLVPGCLRIYGLVFGYLDAHHII